MPKSAQESLSSDHDHADCVGYALQSAEQVCARKGVRLTTLRRRVLELVWESHRPVGLMTSSRL